MVVSKQSYQSYYPSKQKPMFEVQIFKFHFPKCIIDNSQPVLYDSMMYCSICSY